MGLGCFFFQAEDGIRDLVRSRGLGDVYKRQLENYGLLKEWAPSRFAYITCSDREALFDPAIAGDLSLIHI